VRPNVTDTWTEKQHANGTPTQSSPLFPLFLPSKLSRCSLSPPSLECFAHRFRLALFCSLCVQTETDQPLHLKSCPSFCCHTPQVQQTESVWKDRREESTELGIFTHKWSVPTPHAAQPGKRRSVPFSFFFSLSSPPSSCPSDALNKL